MRFVLFSAVMIGGMAPALAESAVQFRYTFPEEAHCPDEETVHSAVAARLGRDPFSPSGERILTAKIDRFGGNLRARIELRDAQGRTGKRELVSKDCSELGSSLKPANSVELSGAQVLDGYLRRSAACAAARRAIGTRNGEQLT